MNLFQEAKQVLDKDGKVNPLGPYGKGKLTGREISTYFRRNKVKDAQIKKAVEVALDLGGAHSIASQEIRKFYGDKIYKSKEVQTALKYANESRQPGMHVEIINEKFKPDNLKSRKTGKKLVAFDAYIQFRGGKGDRITSPENKKDWEQAIKLVQQWLRKHKIKRDINKVFSHPDQGSSAYKMSIELNDQEFKKSPDALDDLVNQISKLKTAEDHGGGHREHPMNEETINENYRTLAQKGMGAEDKKRVKVGLMTDYYTQKDGSKRQGKIVKKDAKGYTIKDDNDGKMHTFKFHDRMKAKKLLAASNEFSKNPLKGFPYNEETKLTEAMSKQMTLKQYANKIGIDAKEKQWIMDNEPDMVAYFPNDKLKGSWNALSYPVRTGDYYFAFLTGDDDKRKKAASDANMKMNDLLKSELATAKKLKFDGEPYTEDMIASYLWNKVYAAFEKLPRNLGSGDTMTREELYRAINDITGGEVQFESFDYQGETIQEGMVSGMLGKILNKIRNARKKIGKKIKLGRKAKIGNKKVHEDVMTTYRLMSEAQPIGSVGIRQDHQSDSNRDARVADWKKKKAGESKLEGLQKKLEFARKQRQRHDDAAMDYREKAEKIRERNPDDRAADGYDDKADRQEEMADNQNNKVQDIKDEIRKAKGIKESLVETTDREIKAIQKLSKDMQSVLKGYQNATKLGDKALKDTKHNPTYKAILDARDKLITLIGTLQTDKLLRGEELEESRMSDLLVDIQQGATAQEISRDFKIPLSAAKSFLKDYYAQKKGNRKESVNEENIYEFNTNMPDKVKNQLIDLFNKAMDVKHKSPEHKAILKQIDKIGDKYGMNKENNLMNAYRDMKTIDESMLNIDKARQLDKKIQDLIIKAKEDYDRTWSGVFVPMGDEGTSQRKEYMRRGDLFKQASKRYKALLMKYKVMNK